MGSMWLEPDDTRVFPVNDDVQPYDDGNVNTAIRKYPDTLWGSDFRAMLVMIEFLGTDNWLDLVNIPAPNRVGGQAMKDELRILVGYQETLRASRLQEIIAQSRDFQGYMTAQLGISPGSHPQTYLMLKMTARVGELVMVALKNYWKKGVRPSQIYPLLFPPVPVPGHSSYPSGHALISKMMVYTINDIVPIMAPSAARLADRIAKNREIAGLHFPSDSFRGKEAAQKAHNIFKTQTFYTEHLQPAKDEWTA